MIHVRDLWVDRAVLILAIVLVVFGAGKLPQLGEGFGKAILGFKRTMRQDESSSSDPDTPSDTPRHRDVQPADASREKTRTVL